MRKISLRKLFQQTFEDHEGREGQVGGSKPRNSGLASFDDLGLRKEMQKAQFGRGKWSIDEIRKEMLKRRKARRKGAMGGIPGLYGEAPSPMATPQKTANTLGKAVGKKIPASSGQKGVYSTNVPIKKMTAAEKALTDMGFEKYKDQWHQDWVTSYKKGKIRVHLSAGENNDMEDIDGNKIFSITVSEQLERLPHIPYD